MYGWNAAARNRSLRQELASVQAIHETMLRVAVSVRTVAKLFFTDERTIRKAIDAGQIEAIQLGDKTLIPTLPLRKVLRLDELAALHEAHYDPEEIEALAERLYEERDTPSRCERNDHSGSLRRTRRDRRPA